MSYQLPSAFLQKFTPKEIHELKRVFKEHDHDYAAAIALPELPTVLLKLGENVTPNQVTTMLKQVALARPGAISFHEFLELLYDFRTGAIALDPSVLLSQASLGAPSPVAPAPPSPSPAPQQTAPAVSTPFFAKQASWKPNPAPAPEPAPAPTQTFAHKPQWPPAQASAASAAAPPAPQKSKWPPGPAAATAAASDAPPKPAATWQRPSPAPPAKAPTPPKETAAGVPAPAPQWPSGASPSKPQWPPAAQAPAAPSKPPQWPPSQPSASPPKPAGKSPQWPPAASSSSPSASPSRAQWPPAASATASASAPSPPAPARASPPRSPERSPAKPAGALDAHSIGVLQRRASAVAMYNANVTIHEVRGSAGGVHSYSEEEAAAFTEHINNVLAHDRDVGAQLPLAAGGGALFGAVGDGVLLCKLINAAAPETIDERAVNVARRGRALNIYEKTENHNLSINAAKSIGCSVVNIGPADLLEGRPILVLGLVWQIIKVQLTSTINLKHHPELMRLLRDGESLEEFMKLPPDQILLRWVNYHLAAAGHASPVRNFSADLQDAVAYSVLLHRIAPDVCDLCREPSAEERAAHVLRNARALRVEPFLAPRDITSGNPKLNMSFVAQLFNTCPALDVVPEELELLEDVLYDDVGDTREERAFRMWINSLAIDGVYITHLFSDVRDGISLLKVLDRVEKGVVAWSKVNLVAPNKFKQVENCNYVVVLGKQLKLSLVNIGGADLAEGSKKLVLSLIWQTMRYQQLKLLSGLAAGGREITDKDILDWANGKVRTGGRLQAQVAAFRDPALSDARFLLDLVHAVEPRAVNWEQLAPGDGDADRASNAKYAISCAQKIGAAVFLTYEDIVEVKPKMIMTFVASLMSIDMHNRRAH